MTRTHPQKALRRGTVIALPEHVEPMLAVAGALPRDVQNWAFEYKWDGVRAISYWTGRQFTMFSRNQITITQRYPELAGLASAIAKRGTILDGEIIALDDAGRPSFARLQRRMHVDRPTPALVRQTPVWYVIFDVLYVGGRSIMDQPYVDRRAALERIIKPDEHWQVSPNSIGSGAAMLQAARHNSLEGVVAKLPNSPYLPGRRSPAWRKVKVVFGQELVIGGWIPEAGNRHDRVGALLLGYYNTSGGERVFRYAGRVGTGFTDATHAMLTSSLKRLTSEKNSFADPIPRAHTLFVKPTLVAEVEYRRWPADGLIQQASFKGLRSDKTAGEVVRESKGAI